MTIRKANLEMADNVDKSNCIVCLLKIAYDHPYSYF